MSKMIKIDEQTHIALKVGAANRGISMKKHIALMAELNLEPIPFNVCDYNKDTLEAVRDDIKIELERR